MRQRLPVPAAVPVSRPVDLGLFAGRDSGAADLDNVIQGGALGEDVLSGQPVGAKPPLPLDTVPVVASATYLPLRARLPLRRSTASDRCARQG